MGHAEEVHKILRGLAEGDRLSLLDGAWSIAVAAPKIAALYLGGLSRGSNLFRAQVCDAVGPGSEWTRLHNIAIGAAPAGYSGLEQQAIAAFWLYDATAALISPAVQSEHRRDVELAIDLGHRSALIPVMEARTSY